MPIAFTDREKTIVHMVIEGKTSNEIAASLNLSPETIKWYRKRLLSKFEVKNFASLVSVLKERGLI